MTTKLKDINTPDAEVVEIFRTQILAKHRPVLHEWFIDTFPDPAAWLASRLAFSRTCAVMSIVGAMLGLVQMQMPLRANSHLLSALVTAIQRTFSSTSCPVI
jgi:hypothetical protein